jgi:hypothetical protein
VLDEEGKVIGVATLIKEEGQNLNFAIAVEKVSAALTSRAPYLHNSQGYVAPESLQVQPQQSISGWKVDGVLMVSAKEFADRANASFSEGKDFTGDDTLNFAANGRLISVLAGENGRIGQIYFKPGARQGSDGQWYLPYPVARFVVEPFLDPTAIRPSFTANSLYLTGVSDKGSQEQRETQKMISAISAAYGQTFRRFDKESPPSGRSVLVLLKINRSTSSRARPHPDCDITLGLAVPPEPMDQKFTQLTADLKLASILAVNMLQGFGHARVGRLSGETVTALKVPQSWDVPTLVVKLELTDSGYERLAKDGFGSVALAMSEGLKAFNEEIKIDPVPAESVSERSGPLGKLIPPIPRWIANRYEEDYLPSGSPEHRAQGCDSMPFRLLDSGSLQYVPQGSWYTFDEKVEYQKP